jgi:hypothetical protein
MGPTLSSRRIIGARLPPPARRSTSAASLARAIGCVAGLWTANALAAGGHFTVDDAAILDVGTCLVETWWERVDQGGSLLHLGPACRVGPLEIGVNADRVQARGAAPHTPVSAQAKWAAAIDERVSVGLAGLVASQGSAPRYVGASVVAPLTLRVADALLLNVNVGRDWLRDVPSRWRAGASLEWQATPAWTIVGERFRQFGGDFVRLGVRWQPSDSLAFDLSRAGGGDDNRVRTWAIGANWTFGAPVGSPRDP